jgi:hypothetical protein
MGIERIALLVSLAINLFTLSFFVVQTRYLARQTMALNRSLEYGAYLKLVDYLNEVNLLLLQDAKVAAVFKDLGFIRERLEVNKGLSIEKIGLAWLILNRYEAALVGYQLGVIPQREWDVWTARLEQDLQIPFIRDVWDQDVSNFDYTPGFKKLVNSLL